MKDYFDLTKFGIVTFVIFTAAGGYFMGHPFHHDFSFFQLFLTLAGLYFLSSGSFALNQYQERHIDAKMPRTKKRPLPSGRLSPTQALAFALAMLCLGVVLNLMVSWKVAAMGLFTVVLYNGCYTLWWKGRSPFAAVPGAIPGAMPFSIGYTAASGLVFTWVNFYFFLIMFLWQMPHFWALALKYKEDYRAGGIPVLPAERSLHVTEYFVGLYTFAYLAVALAAPMVFPVGWAHVLVALPFAIIVLWKLYHFLKDPMGRSWLGFFLWTTFSVLVFIFVPAFDRWSPWI